MDKQNLLKKYDVQAPRYTSYPTVPYWTDVPSTADWLRELRQTFIRPDSTWAMYLHIPFCETLCTYCGCNTAITRNHRVEGPYIAKLLDEWAIYKREVPALGSRPLREIHLGGGTPTFLSAENLRVLLTGIFQDLCLDRQDFQASIEVDPRHTQSEQLAVLRELGFNRISMGVQDYDFEVQRLVNRIQPFQFTKKITEDARAMGYSSVNHDLIYGLPAQSPASIRATAESTVSLSPDRIALYSYAHVPWIKASQRLFTEADLPTGDRKRELYEIAREILLKNAYREIGMDHFALPSDTLSIAEQAGRLHRNFMGYMQSRTDVLLGLGVSAISEAPGCFHQNEKVLKLYEQKVTNAQIPTLRGHLLSAEDRIRREQILQLMTRFQVEISDEAQKEDLENYLAPLLEDGLITLNDDILYVTEAGRPFLRNVCMAFDQRLRVQAPDRKIFSRSI